MKKFEPLIESISKDFGIKIKTQDESEKNKTTKFIHKDGVSTLKISVARDGKGYIDGIQIYNIDLDTFSGVGLTHIKNVEGETTTTTETEADEYTPGYLNDLPINIIDFRIDSYLFDTSFVVYPQIREEFKLLLSLKGRDNKYMNKFFATIKDDAFKHNLIHPLYGNYKNLNFKDYVIIDSNDLNPTIKILFIGEPHHIGKPQSEIKTPDKKLGFFKRLWKEM